MKKLFVLYLIVLPFIVYYTYKFIFASSELKTKVGKSECQILANLYKQLGSRYRPKEIICDEVGLVSAEQKTKLEDSIEAIRNYNGDSFAIVITNDLGKWYKNKFKEFFGVSPRTFSPTIFLVNKSLNTDYFEIYRIYRDSHRTIRSSSVYWSWKKIDSFNGSNQVTFNKLSSQLESHLKSARALDDEGFVGILFLLIGTWLIAPPIIFYTNYQKQKSTTFSG